MTVTLNIEKFSFTLILHEIFLNSRSPKIYIYMNMITIIGKNPHFCMIDDQSSLHSVNLACNAGVCYIVARFFSLSHDFESHELTEIF